MKIAIPVTDLNSGRNTIAATLSATGQLCLFDRESNDLSWMKVSDLAVNLGDLLPALEKRSITDILSANMQPMALKVLVNKGFRVYQSNGTDLFENLNSWKDERLSYFNMQQLLSETNACGGVCDSCNTTCETSEK